MILNLLLSLEILFHFGALFETLLLLRKLLHLVHFVCRIGHNRLSRHGILNFFFSLRRDVVMDAFRGFNICLYHLIMQSWLIIAFKADRYLLLLEDVLILDFIH